MRINHPVLSQTPDDASDHFLHLLLYDLIFLALDVLKCTSLSGWQFPGITLCVKLENNFKPRKLSYFWLYVFVYAIFRHQFWNTSEFMKIYIQQHGHSLFFPVLFLFFPRNKLGVWAWVHAVKHESVVVCDFCWSVICVFIFLRGGVVFCPFLREWLEVQSAVHQRDGRSWWFLVGLTVQNNTKRRNRIGSIFNALPFTLKCFFILCLSVFPVVSYNLL